MFERLGFSFAGFREQAEDQPAEWSWFADPEHAITYVEDLVLRWRFLRLEGPNKESLAVDLGAEFRPFSRQALLDMWDSAWRKNELPTDPEDDLPPLTSTWSRSEQDLELLVGAAHALGLGAGEAFDPDIAVRLAYGMRVPSELVRLATLRGIGLTQWQEFREPLLVVARNDPSPHLRQHAESLAVAMPVLQSG